LLKEKENKLVGLFGNTKRQTMKGLTAIIKMSSGCDWHRLVMPLKYMGIDINQWKGKTFGDLSPETKILLFNRTPGMDIEVFKPLQKQHGFKIVTDLDDYWDLYPHHILAKSWEANKTAQKIKDCIVASDAVIVTTALLADKVKALNKNVHVIPNALPYDHEQFNSTKVQSEFTRFLYAGGSSHFHDIQVLKRPFEKIINNPKFNKSKFILAGVDYRNKESLVFWNKMENSFSLNGRIPGYESRGTLPLDSYEDHYSHCDVTLIPLEQNMFNAYKSNLKILESAAKYNPCIASDTSPYSDFPNRDLVMYGSNAATWFDNIKKFAIDPVFLKEKGQALGEYCREHYNLLKINEYRKQLFEHLMK
jgi:processive 1,2-diacylglycerol beta-glucosyltransferase